MERRGRHSADEWRQLIKGQRESGQTVAAFCAVRGVGESTFGKWKRRLARSATRQTITTQSAPGPVFTPLPVPKTLREEPAADWTVELDLGHGVYLRLRQGS